MLEVIPLLLSCLILRLSVFSHSLLGLLVLVSRPPSATEIRLPGFLDSLTLEDTGVLMRIGGNVNDWPISLLSGNNKNLRLQNRLYQIVSCLNSKYAALQKLRWRENSTLPYHVNVSLSTLDLTRNDDYNDDLGKELRKRKSGSNLYLSKTNVQPTA